MVVSMLSTTAITSPAQAPASNVCCTGIYGELSPALRDFPVAQAFCKAVFPVKCTTSNNNGAAPPTSKSGMCCIIQDTAYDDDKLYNNSKHLEEYESFSTGQLINNHDPYNNRQSNNNHPNAQHHRVSNVIHNFIHLKRRSPSTYDSCTALQFEPARKHERRLQRRLRLSSLPHRAGILYLRLFL
ncbi:hypothetical protein CkaCkLH20_10401 [Colletotrichum karsti]|uniref:Uncharacterized protein n=1 Tax=Colletotrichum karsti TaxID=1095194 RepID=A0A9P6HX84_9PEZI|nr:uncharacterized protein CkaCkLH20_10401 [Colletotrichum karsti]KAF9872064.1 hypothetical protein CkaCkLH20_10401 [Colletotrichum karsti]